MMIKGKVFLLGDDIDTDIIIPTEYLALSSIDEMKKYAFLPLRPDLAGLIKPGDILVAGKNFGCGSSREQAPEVIKALGTGCIIAKSFARIFYRNSINNGLVLIEHEKLRDIVAEGDELAVSIGKYIEHMGIKYDLGPLPENLAEILNAGGLVEAMKKKNKVK
jgi:3-isopropylmalate/(R)-2-methylmalate dehydratase small subunit